MVPMVYQYRSRFYQWYHWENSEQSQCLFRKTTCKSDTIYRIRVVSALGCFGLGRFGQFLGWVVSALVGGSFRPIFEVSRFGPLSFRPKSIETIKV